MNRASRIKTEKGIPMPEPRGRKKGDISKALLALRIGDSFLVPYNHGIYSIAKHAGVNIATRTLPNGAMRVWRKK